MVVGNLLNNKSWVKIVLNSDKAKQKNKESLEFKDNIEKNIIDSAIYCHSLKFL